MPMPDNVCSPIRTMPVLVKQAANVVDLLGYFADQQRPATLAEIAKHFDWPRSSTFNLLATLASRGLLYEPRARGSYYPAPAWTALVQRIERAQPISDDLQQALEALVTDTGETAVLAATSGANALFIAAVESPHAVRYSATPGKLIPLHVTATGRALLSQMSAVERGGALRKARFERYTPTTLMSAAAVEAEIALSVERGWFQGNAEFTSDLGGVALPLALPHRHLAVLVAGPMFRIADRIEEVARVMTRRLERLTLT